jgi:hypothetical protein
MRLHHVLAVSLLLPLIGGADNTGCQSQPSSSVDQARIYTSYWLYYDTNSDATYARAQFRFGGAIGTTLELVDGASATFEGKSLGFNATLDWQEVVLPGKVSSGTFSYTDANGQRYDNPVPSVGTIDFAAVPATISSNQAYELTWAGPPIADGEALEVIVANAANPFTFARFEQRTLGATTIVLSAAELARMPRAASVLSMRRYRDYPLVSGTPLGGKLTTTFQPRDRRFELQ